MPSTSEIPTEAPRQLAWPGFVLDLDRGELLDVQGNPADLRAQALRLLLVLGERAGRLVSKDELMARVWGQLVVTEDSLVQAVRDIRRVLGDSTHTRVRSVPKRGYMLVCDEAPAPHAVLPDPVQVGVEPAESLTAAPAPVPVERSELDGWLVHQRRNRFCPSACQSDPHYKVNRQNANRHRCVLYAWALVDSSWDVAVAARALASPIQLELVSELERGLGVYIAHLKAQLQAARRSEIGSVGGTEGVFRTIPPVLVMRLKREYRRNVGYVLLVLQALVEGALDGGNV